jgi:hypothetical protein
MMSRAQSEFSSALRSFIHYRGKLEEVRQKLHRTGHGDMLEVMHCVNAMGQFRRELAPWEYIACPECGGQGMCVDGGNHWCPRCSGTGILPVCELTDPDEIALNQWKIRYPGRESTAPIDGPDTSRHDNSKADEEG